MSSVPENSPAKANSGDGFPDGGRFDNLVARQNGPRHPGLRS